MTVCKKCGNKLIKGKCPDCSMDVYNDDSSKRRTHKWHLASDEEKLVRLEKMYPNEQKAIARELNNISQELKLIREIIHTRM